MWITCSDSIENTHEIQPEAIDESIRYFLDNVPLPKESPWLALTIVLAPLKSELDKGPAFGFCLKAITVPPEHCSVLACQHAHRATPNIKSTTWIQERKALEARKGTEYNEILLVDNGLVYEGLSSNFAVITDKGTVRTAPNSLVLAGTVMAMVKEISAELGIGVEEECPNIKDIGSWRAAFITSTSRLLLPISQLCIDGYSTLFHGLISLLSRSNNQLNYNDELIIKLRQGLEKRLLD